MKMVMHLGHGQKEKTQHVLFVSSFFLFGEEYGRICVLFFGGGGGGQEYAKIIDLCFREGERKFKPLLSRLG